MPDIKGTCDPRFAALFDILQANIDSGADLGASVAVTLNGETVVDIWGGWANQEKTREWQADTITNVWSTTKTMTNLAALVLASRGELDVFSPVSRYWPEFAQNGKQAIQVRHFLSHTSGVSAWAQPVVVEDLYDWEKSTSMLARQEPWWEPGTASGYHALNQGHLVGEIIRRITGKSLGTFFADEIATPLGADFHIGLDPKDFDRVSNVVPPPPLPIDAGAMDPNSVAFKTFTGPAPDASVAWTSAWRQAEIGAANGHGNARSVARIQSVVACGGEIDGLRLLSPEAIDLIFEEQANGMDLVLGVPARFGIGYGLPNSTFPYLPQDGRICLWGGWGGSLIIVDLDNRMTISYMMNRMEAGLVGDARGESLIRAAYAALASETGQSG
ncbi:MAG: beta-lactamase family protein [Dehalococcoidia bacterium]|nr:beta-lactamase family protein [Dehalococcoidia bacterium]